MRLLVACQQCRRQFDASHLAAGTIFHCRCGEALAARAPQGHDAEVVRCSSCGAPRQARSASCGHCGSDYTLHERNLHTVCPQCAARISDRAKFCHHCGQTLAATLVAGEATGFDCPHCKVPTPLASRLLGDECWPALECGRCAGLWVEAAALEELVRRAHANNLPGEEVLSQMFAKREAPSAAPLSDAPATDAAPTRRAWRYRHCPVCQKMMQRRQYALGSGVIIDVCRDHGVWFDADELHQLLLWVRGGGLLRAQQRTGERERRERFEHQERLRSAALEGYEALDRRQANQLAAIANAIASLFQTF